jgi:hypothetical protein
MGVVYRQKGRRTWMIKYHRNGHPMYESSGTEDKTQAKNLLKTREGDIARGVPLSPKIGRLRFEEAVQDIINDYKVNGGRSLDELERRVRKHLLPYFGGRRLSAITTVEVRAFIAKRQADTIVVRKARAVELPDHRTRHEPKSGDRSRMQRSTAS